MDGGGATIYEELDEWAGARGSNGNDTIERAVDAFYATCLEDGRVRHFFDGVDIDKLKQHQFNFMRYAFSDGRIGVFSSSDMYRSHKRLIDEKGLRIEHFDHVFAHLLETLERMDLPARLIERVRDKVAPLRKKFEADLFASLVN